MSSGGTFVDRIDPFAKRSLKKKQRKSQGSSRYRTGGDVELTPLPLLKGKSNPFVNLKSMLLVQNSFAEYNSVAVCKSNPFGVFKSILPI